MLSWICLYIFVCLLSFSIKILHMKHLKLTEKHGFGLNLMSECPIKQVTVISYVVFLLKRNAIRCFIISILFWRNHTATRILSIVYLWLSFSAKTSRGYILCWISVEKWSDLDLLLVICLGTSRQQQQNYRW